MNHGAYVLDENFLTQEEILQLKDLSLKLLDQSVPTHAPGSKYDSIKWNYVSLIDENGQIAAAVDSPAARKVLEYFKTSLTLAVFYYLMPGGDIHPHRDLTGAKANDRMRFHIPIKTSDQVYFNVSRKRVIMPPGTLWALDTSYLHAVKNEGTEPRVHIVIECDVNEWCRSILVKPDLKSRVHDVFYIGCLVWAVSRSLVINSWRNPKHLKVQINMGLDFLSWRFKSLFGTKK